MNKGRLYGVSVGPGDPELMTLKAVRTIMECQVVAAPMTKDNKTLALDIASESVDMVGKEMLMLYFTMSSDKEILAENHRENAKKIISALNDGKNVAMLNLGDISVYSTYIYIDRLIKAAGYETAIIPGVTSFCAVAAAFGESLTSKEKPLTIIPAGYENMEEALSLSGTKVLMKYPGKLSSVKTALKKAGLYENARMAVNCTLSNEMLYQSLDYPDDNSTYFSTIIIGGLE